MVRSQIYLEEKQIKSLKKIAYEKDVTMSDLIRDALNDKFFPLHQPNRKTSGDTLLEIAKLAKKTKPKAPKDLASNVDKYLYQ